ncbi:MAG TPA: DUF4923 family protein [Bacteroidales bacterium]|nr:DUF4923 family protein [Bacteroidales bacterium]
MIILFSGILIVSCEKDKDPDEKIVGTWNTSTGKFDATIDNKPLLQYFTEQGLTATDAQSAVAFFNTAMQQSFAGSITFKSDNTYTSNLGGQNDSGTWSLNSNRDKLTLDPATGDAFVMNVDTLTDNELVLSWIETGKEDINDDNVQETINVNITMRFTK